MFGRIIALITEDLARITADTEVSMTLNKKPFFGASIGSVIVCLNLD